MIFSHYQELSTSQTKKDLLDVANEGIQAVLPRNCIQNKVAFDNGILTIHEREISLVGKRVFVIGAGKAAAAMAVELEQLLGIDTIVDGVVISNDYQSLPKKITVHYGDHPTPTQRSCEGAKKILALKQQHAIDENDIIISLLSGGASSLLAYPVEGVSLADKQALTDILLSSGVNGYEIPVIKKKISRVKGGRLAEHFYPTPIVSLVLSDIITNDLSIIGSGPLSEDPSTYADALAIIEKYNLVEAIPTSIIKHLQKHKDTDGEKQSFAHVVDAVVGDNTLALDAIAAKAATLSWDVVRGDQISGEARDVAYELCQNFFAEDVDVPTLYLYGGETVVSLDGRQGHGGRNQEFILSCLDYIQDLEIPHKWGIASIATDGVDFIPASAGGIIDNESLALLQEKRIDTSAHLCGHTSHEVLLQLGANLFIKGGTGTNVADIVLFFKQPITE